MRKLLTALGLLAITSPSWAAWTTVDQDLGDPTNDCLFDDPASTDTVVIPALTDIQNGDLVFFGGTHAPVGTIPYITVPPGLTVIYAEDDASNFDTLLAGWYKIAASESGTYTFVGSQSSGNATGEVCVWRPVDQTTPIDVVYATVSHYVKFSNDATPTPQPITTLTPGTLVVNHVHQVASGMTSFTPSSGYTKNLEIIGSNRNVLIQSKEVAIVGVEQAGDIVAVDAGAGDDVAVVTIAFRQATVGESSANKRLRRAIF